MRLLHVDTGAEWRGGQVQLRHLLDHGGGVLVAPEQPGWAGLKRYDDGWMGLGTAILRERPQLLIAHTSRAHQRCLATGLPTIVHRRVDFVPHRRSRLKYGLVSGFVAVSDAVRAVLVGSGVHPDRVQVVWDGVDPSGLDPGAEPRSRRVIAVGALVDHKDHRVLIAAMDQLPDWELWIVGVGPLLSTLQRVAGANVRFLGARSDVRELLTQAAVFCHPSREEGLGQIVLEARAAGVPIVATRAGGVPEVAGSDAILVPCGDPAALARGIRQAGQGSRPPPVSVQPVLRMVEQTLGAYRSLLRRRAPGVQLTLARPGFTQ